MNDRTTRSPRPSGSRHGSRNPRGGNRNRRAAASAPARKPAVKAEFSLPEGTTPGLPPAEKFADMNLPGPLLTALGAQGVVEPFPIQAATLPNALAGRDVLGRGRTGSGKTLAFGLALLARLAGRRAESRRPLGLVLVPTRELAQQVTDALTPYAKGMRLRIGTVVGGLSIGRQAQALKEGRELIVATPGRLRDLTDRGDCDLSEVGITVLDEADQMTDMGFLPQVTALLLQVRDDGQRMLFSATLDRNVDRLVRRFLVDPVVHSVDPSEGAVSTMEHHVLQVTEDDKKAVALRIAAREGRVIMFVDTKRAVDRFVRTMLAQGIKAGALHGGKSQGQRNRTLEQFRNDAVTALVATNVAARGIHIDSLDLVVNVDPPADHKDYLHRGGRTARAGETGTVVTLVTPSQRREVSRLLSDARITPHTAAVTPDDEELARITGAREPSGVPVTVTVPAQPRAAGGGGRSGRTRRSRRGGQGGQGGQGGAPAAGAQGSGNSRAGGGRSRSGGAGRNGPARRGGAAR